MAQDHRFRDVGYYSDVLHYAHKRLGIGVKSARERIRIGRARRALPAIESAFVRGQLSYSPVREVTRVGPGDSEAEGLRLAERLPMRGLERRVAGVVGAKEVCDSPPSPVWRSPQTEAAPVGRAGAALRGTRAEGRGP